MTKVLSPLVLLVVVLAACGAACGGEDRPKPPSAEGVCADMMERVAACASESTFAPAYVDALVAEVPAVAAEREALVTGLTTRIAAASNAEAECASLAAQGALPPAAELQAALAAGDCGTLATGLGAAQGRLIRREVEAPATGRPPR